MGKQTDHINGKLMDPNLTPNLTPNLRCHPHTTALYILQINPTLAMTSYSPYTDKSSDHPDQYSVLLAWTKRCSLY